MLGHIKIIGGKYKGKKIKVIESNHLRPTPNRLRESLFNILQHHVKHACCLDGFAGTGALGLEAYSRGANQVTFLEKNLSVFKQLIENTQNFSNSDLKCLNLDCIDYLKQTEKKFDIIFLDPPFKEEFWKTCYQIIGQRQILNPNGILYLESPSKLAIDDNSFIILKSGKVADVNYTILEKNNN